MENIKFRQPLFHQGKFDSWFYWGFVRGGKEKGFICPQNHQSKNYQYTGLKDKKGVEIYSGDIVHKEAHETWVVEYDETIGAFVVYNQLNSTRVFKFDFDGYDDCPVVIVCKGKTFKPEVIGNVEENPELLKGEK